MYRYRITFLNTVYTLYLNTFDPTAAATQIARNAIFSHYTEVDDVRQVAGCYYHVYCNHGHLGNSMLTLYVTVVEVGIVTERPV